MKNINIKKLLSGFISLCIIAGMALVTFATDVDMAAFVTKDEYLTKYHEIDYRVDDIDDKLDRLYKFTCTNVRTYGGSDCLQASMDNQSVYARGANYLRYARENSDLFWFCGIVASFREEGYLKVGVSNLLNMAFNAAIPATYTFEKTYPASMVKWRDGIEPASNCLVSIRIAQVQTSQTSVGNCKPESETWEIIMGPFDKYPNPTSAGKAMNQGFICSLPEPILPYETKFATFEYQIGTETEPTSWRSLNRGSSTLNTTMVLVGDAANGGGEAYKRADVTSHPYSNRQYVGAAKSGLYYATALPSAIPSGNGNIWLRFTSSEEKLVTGNFDLTSYNLTSWNVK